MLKNAFVVLKKLFGHINAVNGQCKCSPFRLQCLLFALTSVFFFFFFRQMWVFHYVLFVCSQCSLYFIFFLFLTAVYFHTRNWSLKDKNTERVSGLGKNHTSHFCFMSRWTFLFPVNGFSFTLHIHCFCFPLRCCHAAWHVCRVLGWSFFSSWTHLHPQRVP